MGEDGQEVEQIKHHRERLLPVPLVVLEFVALIVLHVELLSLNLPPRAADPHHRRDGLESHIEVGDPRIVRAPRPLRTLLPDCQGIHADRSRAGQGKLSRGAIGAHAAAGPRAFRPRPVLALPALLAFSPLGKQSGRGARFGDQPEAQP
jgi:hypothetical protein